MLFQSQPNHHPAKKVCFLFSRGVGANHPVENLTKSGSGQTEKGSQERIHVVLSCRPDSMKTFGINFNSISQFVTRLPCKMLVNSVKQILIIR